MKTEPGYVKDLTEIRSMMERSTKFLSLTGLSGIMSGIYALIGAYVANILFFADNPEMYSLTAHKVLGDYTNLFLIAIGVVVLTIGTAALLSYQKAQKRREALWNPAARRMVINICIPLFAGGILILILFSKGLLGLLAPMTLIFYGLAFLNASRNTYEEMRYLGICEIVLGLLASYYIENALLFWAIGFGILHIIAGIYLHLKYEK